MIAQRFRPVMWVSGVATAATLLYIVSLQVATERGRLEQIDRQVAATHREIRQLQTELGTRASLRQLERWNGEVLALSAPKASQYISSEDRISSINRSNMGDASAAPPPVMAAIMAPTPNANEPLPAAASSAPAAKVQDDEVGSEKLSTQDRQVQEAFGPVPSAPPKRPQKVAVADKPKNVKALSHDAQSGGQSSK